MNRRVFFASAAAAAVLAACSRHEEGAANADAGKAFLAKNAKEPGVVTRPSGLQYKIVRSGPASGIPPRPQDEVRVHYEGTLLDGTVFDSSYREGSPVVFKLGNLIPAWVEGIALMRPGDEWILYVPAELGYGADGQGPIPPNSVLTFRIELLGVLPIGGPAMG